MQYFRPSAVSIAIFALLVSFGCAGGAWESALREDTPAGYYRYMRDHPDAVHVREAQERIDFHRVQRHTTLAAYRSFQAKYPNSTLLDALRPAVEPKAFEGARAAGSAAAYRAFAEEFPSGEYASRAQANATFLEADGFGGDADALARFAAQHPESDFAAEAERSAQATRLHDTSRIERVALVIRMGTSTPEPKRITNLFVDEARKAFDGTGIELVSLPPGKRAPSMPTLIVEHREASVATSVDGGQMTRPGRVAQTRVQLLGADADAAPIFEQRFELKVDGDEHVDGRSILFGESGPAYWSSFFVPVVAWASNSAVRPVLALTGDEHVMAVDAAGDRAVVLYEDGRFDLIELSDPAKPVVLATYQRPRDFKKFNDVRIVGDRVAIFGDDGIELVAFGDEGPVAVVSRDRADVGSVLAFTPYGEGFVIATSTGVYHLPSDRDRPERVMRRVVRGVDVVGDDLVLADGEVVFVTTLDMLRQSRVKAQLKLGKAFGPARVRADGSRAIVIGSDGILAIDLRDPSKPVVTAKIHTARIGRVFDATQVGHRVFLLGDRGLLVMDPAARTVIESVDLEPRQRVATMGRHVVAVGEGQLQVMDATPYLSSERAAKASSTRR